MVRMMRELQMRYFLPILATAMLVTPALAQTEATDYSDYVPTTELFTGDAEPPDTALVQRLFTLAFTEPCGPAIDGGYGGPEPEVFDFTYVGTYDGPDDPKRKFRLYRFNCSGGAYNFTSVFYGWDELSGLKPLSFAEPSVKPTYEETDGVDGDLVSLQVTGMRASYVVVNPTVDDATARISAVGYWRGVGDASNAGTWQLLDGEYTLVTYDVDASYDGEVNPVRIYDVETPQDIDLP